MNELEIKITYENTNYFQMEFKSDGGDWIVISKHEENGNLPELWPHIQKVCETFFKHQMTDVGEAMKVV